MCAFRSKTCSFYTAPSSGTRAGPSDECAYGSRARQKISLFFISLPRVWCYNGDKPLAKDGVSWNKFNLNGQGGNSWLWPFAALLGYSLVMLAGRFSPFGSSSILYSDMYHQYYPFFVEFRRVLRSGGSLVYNWNLGLGVDYLGLIAYYLASP